MMASLEKILRQSIGSTASTISVLKAILVKSNPVIQASCSSVDADCLVSIHTLLFNESDLRHSTGSTALTGSSAISPPVVQHSSGASRSVKFAEILVSVHTPFILPGARESTRSTASTDYTPISPLVVVNQASGASRAVTTAEFLDLVHSCFFIQPDRFWFSLGCSTDRSTTASMVIAHKVGRCAGKAGLYTWNSFIPEDFSSVSVDRMNDFVIGSYSLFPGMIELIVPPGVILPYGSLPRPPESYSLACLWHGFTDLVCAWIMHSVSKNLGYGIVCCRMDVEDSFRHQKLSRQGEKLKFVVHSCCLDLCEADCHGLLLLKSLACEAYVLMLMNLGGLQVIAPHDYGSYNDFNATEIAVTVQPVILWFCMISLDKQQAVATVNFWQIYNMLIAGFKISTCTFVTLLSRSLILLSDPHIWGDVVCEDLSYFLHIRHGLQELDRLLQHMEIMSEKSYPLLVIVLCSRRKVSLHELLLKQSLPQVFLHIQSQVYGFFGCIYVAISDWFGSALQFLYGSQPRPPDVLFSMFHLKCFMSKMKVHLLTFILRKSIGYENVVYSLHIRT